MFSLAYAFNQSLNNWNVSNVTNMRCMFMFARDFNKPINNWNTKKLKELIPNYIESFNNIEEVYDYIDKNYNKKDDKKVKFIDDIKI